MQNNLLVDTVIRYRCCAEKCKECGGKCMQVLSIDAINSERGIGNDETSPLGHLNVDVKRGPNAHVITIRIRVHGVVFFTSNASTGTRWLIHSAIHCGRCDEESMGIEVSNCFVIRIGSAVVGFEGDNESGHKYRCYDGYPYEHDVLDGGVWVTETDYESSEVQE